MILSNMRSSIILSQQHVYCCTFLLFQSLFDSHKNIAQHTLWKEMLQSNAVNVQAS